MGGAQAIAALAYGTETIDPVDVIVGPGNLYVQEAKRQLSDRVGIDGFAGPSDLLVLFDAPDAGSIRLIALDLLAQAEHGEASLVVAVAPEAALLDALEADLRALWSGQAAPFVLVEADSLDEGFEFAEAFAPEHLELIGPGAEALAPRVAPRRLPVRRLARGDRVRRLRRRLQPHPPDGRHARASPRRSTRGTSAGAWPRSAIEHTALDALIRAGAPIARAEGFTEHARSMTARVPDIVENPT